jgi:L-seryl-tRNA(Ser) seleniumtransferase
MTTPKKPLEMANLLRNLPSVDELIEDLRRNRDNGVAGPILADAARNAIEIRRRQIQEGRGIPIDLDKFSAENTTEIRAALRFDILAEASDILAKIRKPALHHVINATGIVLHTNLGRSPLSEAACGALLDVSSSYSNLEYDVEEGQRGKRGAAIESLLQKLTGTESAVVVNNNAAAVLFAIRMMAEGKEVIVSRGELVEIGGSFRIPDIMRQSGAKMVEVGTTNKTRIEDFEQAIGPNTGLLLKAHTSNYRIIGFTEEVPRDQLSAIAHERGIPLLEDLGSGCLVNIPGLPHEPTVSASVDAGVDVVTFSGDKLLGGPQAGIIVGKAEWVDKLKKHPMMRALRLDKLTLSALEATLRAYLDPERALREVPVLRMLSEGPEEIGKRADKLVEMLDAETTRKLIIEVIDTTGRVGGGAMPTAELKSKAVALNPNHLSANRIDAFLRMAEPPVVGRIHDDRLLLDMRCVTEAEIGSLAESLRALANSAS